MHNTNYEFILCRYGELSTKGKNRRDFTQRLLRNIKSQLKPFQNLAFKAGFDRLYITLNGEDGHAVAEELKHVFGLSSFSLAIKTDRDLEKIAALALDAIQNEEGKTFKILARRHDKSFEHVSDTINRAVATHILKNTELKVDVKKPDIPVIVEIRSDAAYIMIGKIEGAKGYPVGIQGKVMMMLSGGIDSPVASYLMMKRGVLIECVHFASPPYTSQESLNKVIELAKKLTRYQNHVRLHVVPFTDIQLAIYKDIPESYAITMMRRFMLRIGERLAEKQYCLAIGNGENLGQVASQTLQSMKEITNIRTMPVLRPLLTYDKIEIINLAQVIDTYELSILPFDDCCTIFTPKSPTTKPKAEKIEYYETKLSLDELIDKAIDTVQVFDLKYHENKEETSFL